MPSIEHHTQALATATFNLFASFDEKKNLQKSYKDVLFHAGENTLDLFILGTHPETKTANFHKALSVFEFLATSDKPRHIETLTALLSQDYVLDSLKTMKHFYEPTGWLVKHLNNEQIDSVLSASNVLWDSYDKAAYKEHIDGIKGFYNSDKDCVLVTAYLDPKHICYALEKMRTRPAELKIDCEMV